MLESPKHKVRTLLIDCNDHCDERTLEPNTTATNENDISRSSVYYSYKDVTQRGLQESKTTFGSEEWNAFLQNNQWARDAGNATSRAVGSVRGMQRWVR
jgi:hypothetical protein